MSRRNIVFIVLALIAAAFCTRLGFWQLSRLHERRARNELTASRVTQPPVPPTGLPRDVALARLRRVTLAGRYDYAHEVVLTNRSRRGSPGVYIVTPLRPAGADTAVLVTRGWVYSPDGSTVDLARWREGDTAVVTGIVESFPSAAQRRGGAEVPNRPSALRWLDRDLMTRRAGYPLAPYHVVALGRDSTADADSTPVRLTTPALDEGPHLSYAVQWFSFALIALVGAGVFVANDRRKGQ
jgi:surfeit locus 1 family protein